MKQLILILLLGSLALTSCRKDKEENHSHNIGNDIIENSDGNFILVGSRRNFGYDHLYFAELSPDGEILFDTLTGPKGDDVGQVCLERPGGGYAILSERTSTYTGEKYFRWTLTDEEGIPEITGNYPNIKYGTPTFIPESMSIDSNGDYIICGYDYRNNYDKTPYILKVNETGGMIWEKFIPVGEVSELNQSIQTTNGDFVFCGSSDWNAMFLKTNNNGDTLNSKTYQIDLRSRAFSMTEAGNGDFLLYGMGTIPEDSNRVFILRTSPSGDSLNTYITHGGPFIKHGIINMGDGSTVFGINRDDGVYVSCISDSGTELWTKQIASGGQGGKSLKKTADGGFILIGDTYPGHQTYIFIAKLDSEGNVVWTKYI